MELDQEKEVKGKFSIINLKLTTTMKVFNFF